MLAPVLLSLLGYRQFARFSVAAVSSIVTTRIVATYLPNFGQLPPALPTLWLESVLFCSVIPLLLITMFALVTAGYVATPAGRRQGVAAFVDRVRSTLDSTVDRIARFTRTDRPLSLPSLRDGAFLAHAALATLALSLTSGLALRDLATARWSGSPLESAVFPVALLVAIVAGCTTWLVLGRVPRAAVLARFRGRVDATHAILVLEYGCACLIVNVFAIVIAVFADPAASTLGTFVAPFDVLLVIPLLTLAALAGFAVPLWFWPARPPAQSPLWLFVAIRSSERLVMVRRTLHNLARQSRQPRPIVVVFDADDPVAGEQLRAAAQLGWSARLYPANEFELDDWKRQQLPADRWRASPECELHVPERLMPTAMARLVGPDDVALILIDDAKTVGHWLPHAGAAHTAFLTMERTQEFERLDDRVVVAPWRELENAAWSGFGRFVLGLTPALRPAPATHVFASAGAAVLRLWRTYVHSAKQHGHARPKGQPQDAADPLVLGHPRTLWPLLLSEFFERFAFYAIRSALVLYMVAVFYGGDPSSEARSFVFSGTFLTLVYASGVLGGFVADAYLGRRICAFAGVVAYLAGVALICLPNEVYFRFGLAAIAVGVGYYKPSITARVGKAYGEHAPMESGYVLFYAAITLAALLGPTLLDLGDPGQPPTIAIFVAAGMAMVASLVCLNFVPVEPDATPVHAASLWSARGLAALLIVVASTAAAAAAFLVTRDLLSLGLLLLLAAGLSVVVKAASDAGRAARRNLRLLLALFLMHAAYWGVIDYTGSSMHLLGEQLVDNRLLDQDFGANWWQLVNPLLLLVAALPLAWLWYRWPRPYLAPFSVASGLLLAAMSFLLLGIAVKYWVQGQAKLPAWPLFGAYGLLAIAELCITPIALAMIVRLAPPRWTTLVTGCWFLTPALGAQLGGMLTANVSGDSGFAAQPEFFSLFSILFGLAIIWFLFVLLNRERALPAPASTSES